jgi:Homeodomain-like domain
MGRWSFHTTTRQAAASMRPSSVYANLACPAGCPCDVARPLHGPHRVAARLVMILLSHRGWPTSTIAGLLGCDASTLRRWIHRRCGVLHGAPLQPARQPYRASLGRAQGMAGQLANAHDPRACPSGPCPLRDPQPRADPGHGRAAQFTLAARRSRVEPSADQVLGFWRRMGFAETGEVRPYRYDKLQSEAILMDKPVAQRHGSWSSPQASPHRDGSL